MWHRVLFTYDNLGYRPWCDLWIIDCFFRELLEKIEPSIWRVHRRIADDEKGHQLSLYIDTEMDDVELFVHDILKNEEIDIGDVAVEKNCNVVDPAWPKSISRAWPYYAMAVSHMLYNVIDDVKEIVQEDIEVKSKLDAKMFYMACAEEIKKIWGTFGGHAIFHHANIIFMNYPTHIKAVV